MDFDLRLGNYAHGLDGSPAWGHENRKSSVCGQSIVASHHSIHGKHADCMQEEHMLGAACLDSF